MPSAVPYVRAEFPLFFAGSTEPSRNGIVMTTTTPIAGLLVAVLAAVGFAGAALRRSRPWRFDSRGPSDRNDATSMSASRRGWTAFWTVAVIGLAAVVGVVAPPASASALVVDPPIRFWRFHEYSGTNMTEAVVAQGTKVRGELHEAYYFGTSYFNPVRRHWTVSRRGGHLLQPRGRYLLGACPHPSRGWREHGGAEPIPGVHQG